MRDDEPHRLTGPSLTVDPEDRVLDCELDLEPMLLDLIDKAKAAGWQQLEIVVALTDLLDNYMLGQIANAETNRKLAKAIQRIARRGPGPF